jgi:Xaa-Pro dipeptidase
VTGNFTDPNRLLPQDDPIRTVPSATYEERRARVKDECRRRGLAGILLFDQASLFYLFGYDQIGYWVFQTVYLPADDTAPAAVCRAPDEQMIRGTGAIDDVRVWFDESPKSPGDMVTELLRDKGVPAGALVGIELRSHALLAVYADDVRRAVGARIQLTDASNVVADLRVVKDEYEVAWFREAGRHLGSAFGRAREAVQVGARETDVHRAVVDELARLGGDPPAIPPPIASGHRTSTQTHGAATAKRLVAGEPVVVEIGAAVTRYHAVGALTFSLGQPNAANADLYVKMVQALEDGFEAFVPGEPIADVSRRVQGCLTSLGLSRAGRHVGYGTGIGFSPTWLESLRIKVTEPRTLTPGMTFFYFIGLPTADAGSLYIGEPVLITADGYERVARPDYDSWIV